MLLTISDSGQLMSCRARESECVCIREEKEEDHESAGGMTTKTTKMDWAMSTEAEKNRAGVILRKPLCDECLAFLSLNLVATEFLEKGLVSAIARLSVLRATGSNMTEVRLQEHPYEGSTRKGVQT